MASVANRLKMTNCFRVFKWCHNSIDSDFILHLLYLIKDVKKLPGPTVIKNAINWANLRFNSCAHNCQRAPNTFKSSCCWTHPTLRTVLVQRLRQDGHLAAAVGSAAEAIDPCREQSPDSLVSAEILEQNTAMRLAQQLGCSVIVLTARSGVEALVNLLDEGADDVLRKPFGLEELAARWCRTLLKRGRIDYKKKLRLDLRSSSSFKTGYIKREASRT